MSKALTWILIALLVIIVLIIFAALPVRRSAEGTPSPTVPGFATPFPTVIPTPAPTPEVLTSQQERLADLEAAESTELALEQDVDSDFNKLDSELRGL
ncbi:MAG: hypothetical protein G01um101438_416 [Parcubacteria group bacterium Gr01-1014_38]|nr:MAG: hypothetical protein G01um101438_416 [Parcubacteria group bacterium Gr01-1014_38]